MKRSLIPIYLCMFLSGLCSLIYEIVWIRKLTLVFGSSIYSMSTVVTTFMAGLSLGSILFGKYIDKHKNPLLVYAALEAGIAISALMVSFFIKIIANSYATLYPVFEQSPSLFSLIRFLCCFFILLLPTLFMGGTLPVLSKFFIHSESSVGQKVGYLYALNTFGAVAGCLMAGFFLLPRFGIEKTIQIAFFMNMIVAALSFGSASLLKTTFSSKREEDSDFHEKKWLSKPLFYAILISFGLTGFTALGYEVLWTRLFIAILGSSVYAFTLILAAFLSGIALGSFIISHLIHRWKNRFLMFCIFEMALGVCVLLMIPLFDDLPRMFVTLYSFLHTSFGAFEIGQFFLCFVMILAPSTLLGGMFPMVSALLTNDARSVDTRSVGHRIGNLYAINTLGSIVGSFAAGFILIPLFGIQKPLTGMALINMAIGVTLLWIHPTIQKRVREIAFASLVVLASLLLFGTKEWDPKLLYSGAYLYAPVYAEKLKEFQTYLQKIKILYHKEGLYATVTVKDFGNDWLALYINGKGEASSGLHPRSDLTKQYLLGHLPLLLHENPKTALVIGLGSGCALGAATRYSVKSIDAIEISKEVVEAAEFFSRANYNALQDPRVRLIIDDARNFISGSKKKYDAIISHPSNPWVAGTSHLFTQEHYENLKQSLNDGGIVSQWIQYYSITERDFKILLKTFRSVFPYVSVWDVEHTFKNHLKFSIGDVIVIGSIKKINFSREKIKKRLSDPLVALSLKSIRKSTFEILLDLRMMDEKDIDDYVKEVSLNTDDHPVIEFSSPKSLYSYLSSEAQSDILKSMSRYKRLKRD